MHAPAALLTLYWDLQLLARWGDSRTELLNKLVYGTPLVPKLWRLLQTLPGLRAIVSPPAAFGASASSSSSSSSSSSGLEEKSGRESAADSGSSPSLSSSDATRIGSVPGTEADLISLFASAYSHLLFVQDDEEFASGKVFAATELVRALLIA